MLAKRILTAKTRRDNHHDTERHSLLAKRTTTVTARQVLCEDRRIER